MRSLLTSACALLLSLMGQAVDADERQERLQRDLFSACSQGSVTEVKKLLAEGASTILQFDDYGMLPLHEAIRGAHYEVVRLLVAHGALLNRPSALAAAARGVGNGVFLESSASHTKKMIELLLSLGADVNAEDDEPVAAAAGNSLAVVEQLMAAGGRPTRRALVSAVISGRLDIVEHLVKAGVDPLSTDEGGRTLLHEAAGSYYYRAEAGEHLAMWNRLLAFGIPVDARDRNGRTPLFEVCTQDMIHWLIEKKAKINLRDAHGKTALMELAEAEGGYTATMLLRLISAGAEVDARDKEGKTALDHAARVQSWAEISVLLDAGAVPARAADLLGSLAHASMNEALDEKLITDITGRLLPRVGDLSVLKADGLPALSWAVVIASPPLARQLLKAGANVNAADAYGRTPLMLAAMTGNDEMRKLLIEAGADLELKDRQGRKAQDLEAASLTATKSNGDSDASSPPAPTEAHDDLFASVASNRLGEVRLLAASNPERLKQMRGGIQPLHLAASLGRREMVECLIAAGASWDAKTSDHSSCLTVAVMAGQMELARWLLDRADIFERAQMTGDLHALWSAKGNFSSLRLALDTGWLPEKTEDARKALQLAVQQGDQPTTRQLLSLGAALFPVRANSDDPFHGNRDPNLLLLAAQHRSTELLRFLLDKTGTHRAEWRADVAEAFFDAVASGRIDVVKLLVEQGAAEITTSGPPPRRWQDPYARQTKATPLCVAVEHAHRDIVSYLLQKGARPAGRDSQDRPALASAVATGKIELVRLMLEHGAELEERAENERTALHDAALGGVSEITRLLLAKGASPEARDKQGRTPARLAESAGHAFP